MKISYLKQIKRSILRIHQKYLHMRSKHFLELERLSNIVWQINLQCASIPIGSYSLTSTHELIRKQFKGEKAELKNYQHFRTPLRKDKFDLIGIVDFVFIARDEALYREDFLDSLLDDTPYQQWSLQTDFPQRNVTLRNLIWPGYVTYNNDYTFGYAYFGNGIKNWDFEFLL